MVNNDKGARIKQTLAQSIYITAAWNWFMVLAGKAAEPMLVASQAPIFAGREWDAAGSDGRWHRLYWCVPRQTINQALYWEESDRCKTNWRLILALVSVPMKRGACLTNACVSLYTPIGMEQ
jgi:hypothetical protein